MKIGDTVKWEGRMLIVTAKSTMHNITCVELEYIKKCDQKYWKSMWQSEELKSTLRESRAKELWSRIMLTEKTQPFFKKMDNEGTADEGIGNNKKFEIFDSGEEYWLEVYYSINDDRIQCLPLGFDFPNLRYDSQQRETAEAIKLFSSRLYAFFSAQNANGPETEKQFGEIMQFVIEYAGERISDIYDRFSERERRNNTCTRHVLFEKTTQVTQVIEDYENFVF